MSDVTHANVDVVKLLGLGRLPVVFCQVVQDKFKIQLFNFIFIHDGPF